MPRALYHPGDVVGGCTLVARLGRGGMAEVWRARWEGGFGLRKAVAVKVIQLEDGGANRRVVDALLAEGRACALIRHPNVVDLYDLGCQDDLYYAVMEYVDGPTFGALLSRVVGKGLVLPRSVVVDLAIQACRGLAAAHRATDVDGSPMGLVHRDVKPSNLMIDGAGTVKVLDFGIARGALGGAATMTGLTKGTPRYMAPEQWASDGVGPATDLFSLGAVIAELASAHPVFPGTEVHQVYHQLMSTTPASNVAAVAERFPELAPILVRCLMRDPADRPASASALERDLLDLRSGLAARPADLRLLGAMFRDGADAAPPDEAVLEAAERVAASTDRDWVRLVEAFAPLPWMGLDRPDRRRDREAGDSSSVPPALGTPTPSGPIPRPPDPSPLAPEEAVPIPAPPAVRTPPPPGTSHESQGAPPRRAPVPDEAAEDDRTLILPPALREPWSSVVPDPRPGALEPARTETAAGTSPVRSPPGKGAGWAVWALAGAVIGSVLGLALPLDPPARALASPQELAAPPAPTGPDLVPPSADGGSGPSDDAGAAGPAAAPPPTAPTTAGPQRAGVVGDTGPEGGPAVAEAPRPAGAERAPPPTGISHEPLRSVRAGQSLRIRARVTGGRGCTPRVELGPANPADGGLQAFECSPSGGAYDCYVTVPNHESYEHGIRYGIRCCTAPGDCPGQWPRRGGFHAVEGSAAAL
ncbi:protein kinase [Myxococcota bacterium]|nr:protein kinase [Myxococcota bacterium]